MTALDQGKHLHLHHAHGGHRQSSEGPPAPGPSGVERDPVCGMPVDPATARGGSAEHGGRTYHFCSQRCRSRFAAAPERFLGPTPSGAPGPMAAPPDPTPGVEYTCPMHPEIVRAGPGACPICGMALEPRAVEAGEGRNLELEDMTRRLRVGLALSAPLFLIGMSDLLPGQPLQHLVSPGWLAWAQLLLASPVVLWAGWPFFQRGWVSVRTWQLNMFTLIAAGTGAAYLFSLAVTLAPGLLPETLRSHGGAAGLLRGRRGDHHARPAGAGAGAPGPGGDPGSAAGAARPGAQDRARSSATARSRTSRSRTSPPATSSACVPGRRCRSMAWCSTARAPSTSR